MADMEWQLARQWVISTGVSLDNRSIQSSESLHDFVTSLRDGVILCGIANTMRPYCIEYSARKIENINQHEFLCKRNITTFLRTCREVFHIKPKYLFKTNDLYDATNFAAVVDTLSTLSHHKEAVAIQGCHPFSNMTKSKMSKEDNNQIYASLLEVIDGQETVSGSIDTCSNIYDENNYCNSAYNALIYNKSPPSYDAPSTLDRKSEKRDYVINEILDTEEGYIKHIRSIVQSYIPALKAHITSDDELAVFLNIEDIYTFHIDFYRELSKPASNETGCIEKADMSVFSRYKDRFLIYAYYCTHLDESQKRVIQLLKKPIVRDTVEELNRKLERRVSLMDQLSVCFQRVLRYKLLLAELLKNTPKHHEKYHAINNALIAMEDVATYINEFKRDKDVVLEIKHIQSTLKFPSNVAERLKSLCVDFGRHMHDGELQVQFEGTDKREIRVTFLFEKALLLCKPNGEFNKVLDILCMHKLSVRDSQLNWKGRSKKTEGKFSYCFTLTTCDEADISIPVHGCRIFTRTEALKRSWMCAIRKCTQIVTLQGHEGNLRNHVFCLTTLDCGEYYLCDVCRKLLLGQVSQGYICQNGDCKLLVHKTCLQNCPPCQHHLSGNVPTTHNIIDKETMVLSAMMKQQTVDEVTALTMKYTKYNQILYKEEEEVYWFSGQLSRDQSEQFLRGSSNGSFLIRENKDGWLVLSVQCNDNSFHIKIKEDIGQFYLTESQKFNSIEEIISYYQENTLRSGFPQLPTLLTEMKRKPTYDSII